MMNKKILLILLAVSLMAGSSMAAVINVFGYDWTLNPEAGNQIITKNSETSLSILTDYVSVGYVTMQGLGGLSVGDTVSYDRYISGGDYMSWYRAGAIDSGGVALDFYQEYLADYVVDSSDFIGDMYTTALGAWTSTAPGVNSTGIHMEYFYDSATTYVQTLTDIASGAPIFSVAGVIGVGNPADDITSIDGWLFAEYVGDNEIRIDNFVITPVPEPATMAILGLGGLLIRRRKR